MTQKSSPNPLITLWYKPGQTLQGLIADGKGGGVSVATTVLLAVVMVWPAYSAREMQNVGLLLLASVIGLAGLFLFSWLLRNFGRWFGGEAKVVEVRTALGWGLLPWAVLSATLLIFILAIGSDPQRMFPVFFVILIYGFVILLSALSVALRVSVMKTFLCFILTFIVSIFPLTLVMQFLAGNPNSVGG